MSLYNFENEEDIKEWFDRYSKGLEPYGLKVKYEIVERIIYCEVSTVAYAKFTLNGNKIKITERFSINALHSHDPIILAGNCMQRAIGNLIAHQIWQREGNITTNTNQDEGIKANKEDKEQDRVS